MRGLVSLCGALMFPLSLWAQERAPDPLFVRVRGHQNRVRLDTAVVWRTVSAPVNVAFRNVVATLDEMKIPVTGADSVVGRVHHTGFVARTRLAGEPMSRFFSCGRGLSGEYADMWRVNIAYAIYVRGEGDGSRIGIAMVAGASDVEGASKPAVTCGMTGAFANAFARAVDAKSP